ncbi:MAG: hypothetical protein DI587_25790 [Variovorax paradoxus]|nr:MAG: hypothetical protein DI583_25790 [Variovorax paradoxus]PZQ05093.1 MAG: hypothetical protein DI587_25790 [Variovorax paradoxus]
MQHQAHDRLVDDGVGTDTQHGFLGAGGRRLHHEAHPRRLHQRVAVEHLDAKTLRRGIFRLVDSHLHRQAQRLAENHVAACPPKTQCRTADRHPQQPQPHQLVL